MTTRITYNFMADFSASYSLACRMLALRHGSVRAATCWEFYWCEGQGVMP